MAIVVNLPGSEPGSIIGESSPPNVAGNFKPLDSSRMSIERKQRADYQSDLVMRLMEAENRLSFMYKGEELERKSKEYKECAQAMLECSNVLMPGAGGLTVKGGENNARHLSGVKHCQKAICPICLTYQDQKRREKLELVASQVAKLELNHFVFTITLRHHYSKNGNWRILVDAIKTTWRSMGKQRFFREALKSDDVKGGFFWKLETTFTFQFGQHPHLHVLLSLPKSVDAIAFSEKVQEYWEAELRKAGRSCEWQPGWWQSLRTSSDIKKMVKYLTSGIAEVTGAATKKLPPWMLEPAAFVEIFHSMRNIKWFGSGGLWRTNIVVEAESESNLEAERESKDPIIYVIPRKIWNGFDFNRRFAVRKIIADRKISHDLCINQLDVLINQVLE